jgi:hypothetical protein
MIVGHITAYEHRGWVRVVMTSNVGTRVYMGLDADAAWEFLWGLEWALGHAVAPFTLGALAETHQSGRDADHLPYG